MTPWQNRVTDSTRRMADDWRSQKTSKNWSEFFTYLDRHPVAGPVKLKDLIAAK